MHHGLVHRVATDHTAQRDNAIGHAFGKVQHVWHDTKVIGGKRRAHAAETGDDFIKDQQDAVLVAYLSQSLEIALGRYVPARAARHRLDNDGRHIARVMQRQNALLQFEQPVLCKHRQFTLHIRMVHRVVDKAQMVDLGQHRRAKCFAVAGNTAHAHAAKAHAMVSALTTDEQIALPLSSGAVVGQRDFQRGVCRL